MLASNMYMYEYIDYAEIRLIIDKYAKKTSVRYKHIRILIVLLKN